MSKYLSRGSEWHRWDLHVHTKGTMKNDLFTSQDFDSFCTKMFRKAIENNIAAIGITDYFNIENYKKVRGFIGRIDTKEDIFNGKEKEKIKKIFILPNVELRMLPVTDKGNLINIHCLFNPDYTDRLENDFFNSLECSGCKMNKQGLIQLGRENQEEIDEKTAYRKGVNSFYITAERLQELLNSKQELKENILIALSNASNDGASGLREHYTLFDNEPGNLDTAREMIYKISDAIFSSNDSDRKFFLGQKDGSDKETVIRKCGSLKPCIHGSDAHTEKKLFKPDQNRYCWIKADLNFEGLKQILHEPEDRVKIQEIKPDEKETYQIIDSVQFNDDKFMKDEIPVNQNLTAIIGGKSTGKSLLLRSISETIDMNEVTERFQEIDPQELEPLNIDGFEVIWKDGQKTPRVSGKTRDDHMPKKLNKKIIYIPQSYLNRLVEKKEEKGSIHKIIEDVLKQEKDEVYDSLADLERENKQKIATNLARLFNCIESLKELTERLRDFGDKQGVSKEIEKLESEITELKKTTGMSKDDIDNYNNLVKKLREIGKKSEQLKSDKNRLERLKEIVLFDEIDLSTDQKIKEFYDKLKGKTETEWKKFIDSEIDKLAEKLENNNEELKQTKAELAPLLDIARKSDSLKEKIEQIKEQQNKLEDIQKIEESRRRTRDGVLEIIKNLSEANRDFHTQYESNKEKILGQNVISGELNFTLETQHKTQSFQDFINEVFDNRTLPGDLSEYRYTDNNKFSETVEGLIRQILSQKIRLKTRYTQKDVATRLLQNWYQYDYRITQDGDDISKMSPGKRSLVLLKLLIKLDNSKCPILLDQPEDDLDNRSIYRDLARFIKSKKKERQIIIITHNPNLVVGADAECVIVANQKGTHSQNRKYQFEYVSGALENTFSDESGDKILYKQGICEHVCDILEGGNEAFVMRGKKYGMADKN